MEFSGLKCNGCGSTNVFFDAKKRMLICNQCGKEEYYSRATLNANGKVILSKDNAIRFFLDGNFEGSQHYALDVLNISQDNAPALFIMSYYDEFIIKKDGSMHNFFNKIKDVSLEYNEVRELIKLFETVTYNMSDYEKDMLELIAANMQSQDDVSELSDFVDRICPYIISKRSSISFLTKEMTEIYGDFAQHCGIPKTCFALIKAIRENMDSPYINNDFYLKSKSKYFYDNYILPVGHVIDRMRETDIKSKFILSYEKIKKEYEEAMC